MTRDSVAFPIASRIPENLTLNHILLATWIPNHLPPHSLLPGLIRIYYSLSAPIQVYCPRKHLPGKIEITNKFTFHKLIIFQEHLNNSSVENINWGLPWWSSG